MLWFLAAIMFALLLIGCELNTCVMGNDSPGKLHVLRYSWYWRMKMDDTSRSSDLLWPNSSLSVPSTLQVSVKLEGIYFLLLNGLPNTLDIVSKCQHVQYVYSERENQSGQEMNLTESIRCYPINFLIQAYHTKCKAIREDTLKPSRVPRQLLWSPFPRKARGPCRALGSMSFPHADWPRRKKNRLGPFSTVRYVQAVSKYIIRQRW